MPHLELMIVLSATQKVEVLAKAIPEHHKTHVRNHYIALHIHYKLYSHQLYILGVSRETDRVTETLFKRAEHLLQIPRIDRVNAEDMQVVHYQDGQRYEPHHDWGVSGYQESRYITLLLYLNDLESPEAGGETSFPKAADGAGIKVHPGKGSAVLFYNLLEDGNGDDLALHAALPIFQGEKWLANFWVWDPKRK